MGEGGTQSVWFDLCECSARDRLSVIWGEGVGVVQLCFSICENIISAFLCTDSSTNLNSMPGPGKHFNSVRVHSTSLKWLVVHRKRTFYGAYKYCVVCLD